jgi:thioredoxin-like negative regulator of GroEL
MRPVFAVLAVFGVLGAAGPVAGAPVQVSSIPGLSVESAALLLSGQQGGELPLTGVALPVAGPEEKARLLLRLRIDGPALLAGQTGERLRIEVAFYALGEANSVQATVLQTVEISLADLRGAVEAQGVDVLAGLDLRPGTYSLRLLVRNPETGRLGLRILPLTIPDLASLEPASSLSGPPPAGDPRPTARAAGLGLLDPPPFPNEAGVAAPAPGPAAAAPADAPPFFETIAGRRLRSAFRAAYREALGRLAAGREAEARSAVAALEDAALSQGERGAMVERLVELETAIGRELAAADPASLVPVLRLHQRLFEGAAGRLQGSTLARATFLGLLKPEEEGGNHPEIDLLFISTFGAELLRSGSRRLGEPLLGLALERDPGHELALLELAMDAERRGAREEAVAFLQSLLRAHPDHRDARLRYAVNLARLGRADQATEGLSTLIREETGGWRLSLAYQEPALLQQAEKFSGAAEKTLREGLARLPGDEKLTLLLATLLERSGRLREAREVLARLSPEGEGGGTARHLFTQRPEEPLASSLAALDRAAAQRLPALANALKKTAK